MNNNQENQFSMAKAVQQVLNNNIAIVSTLPAFSTAKNDLDDVISAINEAAQSQLQNTTGTAQDKEQAALMAIEKVLTVTGPAKSYAKNEENNTLFQSLDFTRSVLQKMRDTELSNTLTSVSTTLAGIIPELATYGITAAELADLDAAIETYNSLMSAPRTAITNKSAATAAVAQAFINLKPVFIRLDGLAEGQKTANPVFYNAYKAARVVVDSRGKAKSKTASNPAPQQ
jgi:hypothetical protein